MTNNPVSADMIDAVQIQNELFGLVREFVPAISKEVLGKDAIALENFRTAINYRSVLLTFEVNRADKRKGKFPYGWFIYYNNPTILVFAKKINNGWEEGATLDLEKEFYFQIDDDEKHKVISKFVHESLQTIK